MLPTDTPTSTKLHTADIGSFLSLYFQDQPFTVVMEEMANSEEADFYHVMLVPRDKILRPTATPTSTKLHAADIGSFLSLYFQDQPFTVVMEEMANSEEADFYHVMLVPRDKILRPTATPTSTKLHAADIGSFLSLYFQDQPFTVVMEEMANSEEADFYHVMLVHRDKILRPTDTPTSTKLHAADIGSFLSLYFQDQPFTVVMEEMANSEEADFYHVMLVHRDKILRPTDTPTSIKLHTADIISKYR